VDARPRARRLARRVPASNLHVTLVFLGATPEERVPAIGEALHEACADVQAPALCARRAAAARLRARGGFWSRTSRRRRGEQVARAQELLARRLDRVESRGPGSAP
jgi:hypothetical protein